MGNKLVIILMKKVHVEVERRLCNCNSGSCKEARLICLLSSRQVKYLKYPDLIEYLH